MFQLAKAKENEEELRCNLNSIKKELANAENKHLDKIGKIEVVLKILVALNDKG